MGRNYSFFLLFLIGSFRNVQTQELPAGQRDNIPIVVPREPMVNEGSTACAQFVYAPNSLSGSCLTHKLTMEADRYEGFSISLTGLEVPELSGTTEVTFEVNQCRNMFELSCVQNDFCTIAYYLNGYKATLKLKELQFVMSGELVTVEINQRDNKGTKEIYRCQTSVDLSSQARPRYEIRLYLSKAFPGHSFEINGGDVRKYRNGEPTLLSTTTEETTRPVIEIGRSITFTPFATLPSVESPLVETPWVETPFGRAFCSKFGGPCRILPAQTTQAPNIQPPFGHEPVDRNSVVTVNGMQKNPDGKSMILDLTIRTRVEVPNTFF